jgi:phosphate starvation-inducible PhoH-like protein
MTERYPAKKQKRKSDTVTTITKPKWEESLYAKPKPIATKTKNQALFLQSIKANTLTVGSGSSGSGKSYLACYHAANELLLGNTKKIIISRPYVALAGRTTGFKPSTDIEKLRGFVLPMLTYLGQVLGKAMVELEILTPDGKVELAPLESLRGRSFDNAIIIIDESQCLLPEEVEAIVTRVGENSKIIFCGDPVQRDVKEDKCGLLYLERIIHKHNISNCGIIKFTSEDCVRSGLCKEFVQAFDKEKTG